MLAAAPDLIPLAAPPELAAVVGRLLSKEPGARYPSAEATIAALRQAAGLPSVPESAAIRESFLQAAAFVGREAELAQLRAALGQALAGQGSAWLVGGESGVGKSRLLEELRTEALVAGALVVRGQGVEGGGAALPALARPAAAAGARSGAQRPRGGILKDLVPDIGALLGRAVPDAPMLEGVARRQRLADTIAQLLRRQRAASPAAARRSPVGRRKPGVRCVECCGLADAAAAGVGELSRRRAAGPAHATAGNADTEARPALAGGDRRPQRGDARRGWAGSRR